VSSPTLDEHAPSLCLVAHFAYGALTGGRTGHVGGVEWQMSLTARCLAAKGYRVSLLTWDEGQEDDVLIDGVRVIKMCRRDAGLPGLRFLHPRWTSLNQAMERADADLYYHNCGEYVTGQVAMWCRRHERRFVYSVASDPDCDARLPEMKTLRERLLYRYGLRHADRIIVQKETQREMLRSGFGLEPVVIPMPCPGPVEDETSQASLPRGGARVVWVGRIVELKRLEWLLDVAEAMPEVEFDVVGTPACETPYIKNLFERARRLRNVTMAGRVERSRMPGVYQRASCLCCTSAFEGFPNTFLEAWSHGLPVVSSFDPDDLIASRGLGAVARDVPGLVAGLRGLLESPDRWREASRCARRYYLENHTVDDVMSRFESLFLEVLGHEEKGRVEHLCEL
jgi:glycosyltransferase involved in cell wall biosynthesis